MNPVLAMKDLLATSRALEANVRMMQYRTPFWVRPPARSARSTDPIKHEDSIHGLHSNERLSNRIELAVDLA